MAANQDRKDTTFLSPHCHLDFVVFLQCSGHIQFENEVAPVFFENWADKFGQK